MKAMERDGETHLVMMRSSLPSNDGLGSALRKASTVLKSANSAKTEFYYQFWCAMGERVGTESTLNFLSWSRLMRTAFVLPYLEKKLSNLDCSVASSSGKPFWIVSINKKG